MPFRSILAAVIAFIALTSVVTADGPIRVEITSFQENGNHIIATITATGADGRPVANLTGSEIKAGIDGQALNVSAVQSASAASNAMGIVLLVDVSGSMTGDPINQARAALGDFARSLNPGDAVALYSFDAKVHLLQDFTSDRNLVNQALGKLQATGDTALYDAVSEGSRKIGPASYPRKLIVVLTDGEETVHLDQRAASIDAARQTAVPVIAIGLGRQIDRGYLGELTEATGGNLLVATAATSLRSLYQDLANSIKAQYTVSLGVPDSVDRSVAGKLTISVNAGANSGSAEKAIGPLAGARPPSFSVGLEGLSKTGKVTERSTLTPVIPADVAPVSVEYIVDDKSLATSTEAPFGFDLDPAVLAKGNHVIRVLVTDVRGRQGEWQAGFASAPAAAGGKAGLPVLPIMAVLALGAAGAFVLKRKRAPTPEPHYETRIKPWSGRVSDPGEAAPEFQRIERLSPPPPPPPNATLGSIIVMHERGVQGGDLQAIREFEIGTSPITLGTSPTCDIVVVDPDGRIAGEEARLWVQKGRLVFHKLTTLSAMAMEGLTSGWLFLDSGEELQVGPYRISFQAHVTRENEYEARVPLGENARLRDMWPRTGGEPDRLAPSPDY